MRFRQKSTPQKVADVLGTYVKTKAITKTVKGVTKLKAVQAVGKRMPGTKALPVMAGVGAAAAGGALAARRRRHGDDGVNEE